MKKSRIQKITGTLRALKKEKETAKRTRLAEKQVEEMEAKRRSLKSFYRNALEILQDEVKKYWGTLKY